MALPLVARAGLISVGRRTSKKLGEGVKPIAVVVFRTGPKRYAYINPGFDIRKGDTVLVPTESGVDLEATVVMMTATRRWADKATKEVLSEL